MLFLGEEGGLIRGCVCTCTLELSGRVLESVSQRCQEKNGLLNLAQHRASPYLCHGDTCCQQAGESPPRASVSYGRSNWM